MPNDDSPQLSPPDSQNSLPPREFGWSNMWASPEDDPREEGGEVFGERDTLVRYLRDYRLTLEMKCAGLDADAMARRSVEPSNLSLLGLVRHLAGVEQYWFRIALAGQEVPRHYRQTGRNTDFDGAVADPGAVAEAWQTWRAEVEFAERFVAEAPDLDVTGCYDFGEGRKGTISLRRVLVHMVEEYARHMGHADFLRERIDGRVGQ